MDIPDDVLLLAEYGSRAYGASTSSSDHDLMGIYLESDAQIYGLAQTKTRQTDLGRRSTSADTDVTLHPLRKYVSLAAGGNPTVLSLLWSPEHLVERSSPAAEMLIAHRELFITRRMVDAHLGYAMSQRTALTGEGGKRVKRPELVEQHGYDTKFALHLLRLLMQAVRLVEERRCALPMPEDELMILRAVRAGQLELRDVLARADHLALVLHDAEEQSSLPRRPDPDAVDRLLIDLRRVALS